MTDGELLWVVVVIFFLFIGVLALVCWKDSRRDRIIRPDVVVRGGNYMDLRIRKMVSTEYIEGEEAYRAGKPVTACPYDPDKYLAGYNDWMKGWFWALEQAELHA